MEAKNWDHMGWWISPWKSPNFKDPKLIVDHQCGGSLEDDYNMPISADTHQCHYCQEKVPEEVLQLAKMSFL